MNKQQGSAHAAVVIVLVVALLGALGFIFWQNFIKKDAEVATKQESTKTTEEQKVAEEKVQAKTYDSAKYSFEYPASGWLVMETRNDYDPTNNINPEVRTTDYSPSEGMAIDAGAKVTVYTTAHTIGTSLARDKEATMMSLPDMKDVQDTTLGGVPAYSYSSGYEGYRYSTSSIFEGTYYQIVYQYAGDDQSIHRDGYDTIVKSFKFK